MMQEHRSFVLHGGAGTELEVLDYGGKVKRLSVPDRSGRCENVAMSLDFSKPGFGGSLVGRYANRIAGGKFAVDGTAYELPTNIAPDGMPCLIRLESSVPNHTIRNVVIDRLPDYELIQTGDVQCVTNPACR